MGDLLEGARLGWRNTEIARHVVYVGERQLSLDTGGSLADIAPTMLALMGLPQPAEMTGRSLIKP